MDFILRIHEWIMTETKGVLYYAIFFLGVIGLLAQWRLYEKAKQPGWTCLVPFLNFIVFLRIVGRPPKHLWLFFIPIYGQFYMLPKVWIEICECFGKRTTLDHVLAVVLNGLYILNLGLDEDANYLGPIYGKPPLPKPHKLTPRPQAA
jgi:hypothetical protein